MNNMGNNESPWRTPLLYSIGGPCLPFNMILEDAMLISDEIHLRQVDPNPRARSTLRRNDHDKLSKAFEMSSLRSSMGTLFFLIHATAHCMYLKLSWMLRFLMKAFWFLATSESSLAANLRVRILEASLVKL